MDVEITFASGRKLVEYDELLDTPEKVLAFVRDRFARYPGWMQIGDAVFHSQSVESLRSIDPEDDSE